MVPGVISEDCGNWDKNRVVTNAMYRIESCEVVEIFRNGSVHKKSKKWSKKRTILMSKISMVGMTGRLL